MKFPWQKAKPQDLATTPVEEYESPETWDEGLYQVCLDWRRNYAHIHGLDEHQILTDEQLKWIAYNRPLTNEEFKDLGFDATRTDLFEEALVLLVANFDSQRGPLHLADTVEEDAEAYATFDSEDHGGDLPLAE